MRFIDKTGQTFGRLTVLRRGDDLKKGWPRWVCQCSCGREALVWSMRLRPGGTQSCGCLIGERVSETQTTHGLRQHPLYNRWKGMMARCYDDSVKCYKDYGGRGIAVYIRWHNPSQFVFDIERSIGPIPFKGATLDRINNGGHYKPGNIRWADRKTQANNRRPRRSYPARRADGVFYGLPPV